MSTTTAYAPVSPVIPRRTLFRYWQGTLRGSEFTWAVAFVVPYFVVFLAFVVYPVFYGAWMGSNLQLYRDLFADPIYQSTVVNTALFLVFGVNLKLFLALMLSGFFMHPGWPTETPADDLRAAMGGTGAADVHLDPLAVERRVGLAQQHALSGVWR